MWILPWAVSKNPAGGEPVHMESIWPLLNFWKMKKKRAAQVQCELFRPPVFDLSPVSSWWFCCVCPQSHSLQTRIHHKRQRWHHSCNALLKITRTKKCFEFSDDNYPDLKISRHSTRQGEIKSETGIAGRHLAKLRSIQITAGVGCRFPTLWPHLQCRHHNWHMAF